MKGKEGSKSIDELPVTGFHWGLSTLAAMGIFLDGYDLNVIAFSVLLVSSYFKVSTTSVSYALLLASGLIGMAIGGVTLGGIADKIGRKTMFIINIILFIFFTLLSAVATNVPELIIFRVLMGIGLGADYPISSSLIAEFAPKRDRGKLLMYGIMFYWLGVLVSGAVNYFALPLGAALSWRVALGVGAAIAIPVIAARWFMPESARWLNTVGRNDEAELVMEKAMGPGDYNIPQQRAVGIKELFSKHWKQLAFVLITWFAFDVGAYGFGFYTPTLYYELGIKSLSTVVLFGTITAPFPILAYLALMRIIDRYGRKYLSLVGFAVMAVVLVILVPLVNITPYALLPLFILFSSFEQWPGGIFSFSYSTELFPTNVRGLAQGLGTSVSRIGGILGVLLFPIIKGYGLIYGTVFFLVFILLAIALTAIMAPETSRKSLEDTSS
ncbi:MAG: MFS transporter [Nitrososphaerota archaeon]|nr:MFS transporter [Nitrososphaerota archaeon]MDG7045188.1 MFS transporter [Nitrososphaerota archaeon]MDG7048203.1 MFS transporter [Nitrososphaerota archaeon]